MPKLYQPCPHPKNYRIKLAELADETPVASRTLGASGTRGADATRGQQLCETFRTIWLDPLSLDPARRAAKVTREFAGRLAKLAKSLEQPSRGKAGSASRNPVSSRNRVSLEPAHTPEAVAQFPMRCLFATFAEDVKLIPKGSFTALLESLRETPAGFAPTVAALWREMDTGCDFSVIIKSQIKRFNGGLFEAQAALPLNADQLDLTRSRNVSPATSSTAIPVRIATLTVSDFDCG